MDQSAFHFGAWYHADLRFIATIFHWQGIQLISDHESDFGFANNCGKIELLVSKFGERCVALYEAD